LIIRSIIRSSQQKKEKKDRLHCSPKKRQCQFSLEQCKADTSYDDASFHQNTHCQWASTAYWTIKDQYCFGNKKGISLSGLLHFLLLHNNHQVTSAAFFYCYTALQLTGSKSVFAWGRLPR
jgi:hypothetical protein